jgi:hypothetical protein
LNGLILEILLSTAMAADAQALGIQLEAWRPHRLAKSGPSITVDEVGQALSGKIVSGVEVVENIKAGKGYALAVFDIPIAHIWRGIVDEDHHAEHLMVDVSKTVEGTPRQDQHTLFQYLDVPIFSDRWWVVKQDFNEALYASSQGRAWEVAWTDRQKDAAFIASMDPALIEHGIPIRWAKGAWFLVDLGGGRTFVEYHTWTHPGGKVPVGPATRFAAGEVRDNLEAMVNFSLTHALTCGEVFVRPDGSPL